jgi:hypothetical protein
MFCKSIARMQNFADVVAVMVPLLFRNMQERTYMLRRLCTVNFGNARTKELKLS